MSALLDYMQLCRLCLVKDKVNVPIFGDTNDVRQIFLKITACLPVKVSQDDNLPQKICDSCLYKVDLLYQFWNTSVNAEKQLIQWLSELGVDIDVKNSDAQPLQIMPQSHAHPHSIHTEAIMLKEEHQDSADPSMFGGFNIAYQPDASVASTTEFDTQPAAPVEQVVAAAPKRRGRPPKQKTPPKKRPPLITPAAASTRSPPPKRRSSAAAAAAAVAAAAAAASDTSDESDGDDHMVADDSDDEDDEVQRRITKEEADSDDEEYIDNPSALEPTTFVGVPSTSGCDTDQPGPSGLNPGVGGKGSAAGATAAAGTESGEALQPGTIILESDDNDDQTESAVEWEHDYAFHTATTSNINGSSEEELVENVLIDKTDEVNHLAKPEDTNSFQENLVKDHKCYSIRVKSDGKETHQCVYECDICGKKFRNKRCAKICQKKVPKDPYSKYYLCEICGKIFTYISSFIAHHNHTHADQNLFLKQQRLLECTICHKRLSTKWNLKTHMKSHFDVFPFLCEFCGKKFKKSDIFKIHLRVHTGIKPYACTQCPKRFTTKGMVNTHMRSHTGERPYGCDLCDRKYAGLTALRMHRRTHTGERPFKCHLCPTERSFSTKKALRLHLKQPHHD